MTARDLLVPWRKPYDTPPPVALLDLRRRVWHALRGAAEIETVAETLLVWARTAEPKEKP